MRITHILETHRNEDYCIGSVELAARTGAQIWHADSQFDYQYGRPAENCRDWEIGRLRLTAMHTPGHTPGSMSYLLHDKQGNPWIIFTGDLLFAGDVGRMDLMGKDRLTDMAAQLFQSIHEKILPLGDGVIVCPAHGPGSVCGTAINDRPWTTIGTERLYNTKLQYQNKNEFIKAAAGMLERPPYFRQMENLNMAGAPLPGPLPALKPLSPQDVSAAIDKAVVLDIRNHSTFATSHVPGSLSIWPGGLAGFAGWFLPYDRPLVLVVDPCNREDAVRILLRMGFDKLEGYLARDMLSWHTAGYQSSSVATITVQELCQRLDNQLDPWILDVRSAEELEQDGRIPYANHIHITQLPNKLDSIPKEHPVYIFCASGLRSMIAASLLKKAGYHDPVVILGGFSGWTSTTCPIQR
ncbi:MAG: MBL fold metallo-hydrolase, partial [Bacillota bacterium]|nr:MBL fold metallo-hydrolase [Bacillota bacterium]